MVQIQFDLDVEINKKLKLYMVFNNIKNKGKAVNNILNDYFTNNLKNDNLIYNLHQENKRC